MPLHQEVPQDIELAPQPGPQEAFLESTADIVIYGGQAGGGKTFGMLMEPLRHLDNPRFGAVIFRRTFRMIMAEGGIWDTAMELYPYMGGEAIQSNPPRFEFPSGMSVSFAHMQHEKNRLDWKSAQIPLIQFDQLEEFTSRQFWYMLSRNRSTSGVKPYIRAGCNPVPPEDPVGGWLHDLIGWWIGEDGYPIAERSGVVRWFVRDKATDELVWGDSPEDVAAQRPNTEPEEVLSITFIPAALEDNPALLRKDPGYRAKLMALSAVERERLLGGNWLVAETAGMVFDRANLPDMAAPAVHGQVVRYWDKAGTPEEDATSKHARSAGVALTKDKDGRIAILDVVVGYWKASKREAVIKQTADADARRWGSVGVVTWIEQEPGSGGKESAENTAINLLGHDVRLERATGDKIVRMRPLAAQTEVGNVYLVTAEWNEEARREFHRVAPGAVGIDIPDAAAGAFNKLVLTPQKKPLPPSGGYQTY